MIGALWTGISGLSSHQKALDNEATNIANVNTVGYKASRISFADQMYQDKIGKGSKVLDAEKLYTQGNLKVTGVSFDMALSGSGFFTVSDTRSSGSSETYYTRAGNFRMGEDGTLQDAAGNKVQGWAMGQIDSDADVNSTNQNVSYFTNDYTKLAASKIIRHASKIETITAKMTDYTKTSVGDELGVFSGAGYKSKSAKISDIEALISDYNSKLTSYQSDPAAMSIPSVAQVKYVQFKMDTADSDGNQFYVFINGEKKAVAIEKGESANDALKRLADDISSMPGFKANIFAQQNTITASADAPTIVINGVSHTITDAGTAVQNASAIKAYIDNPSNGLSDLFSATIDTTDTTKVIIVSKAPGNDYTITSTGAEVSYDDPIISGRMRIESIIPGKSFSVGEVAESKGSTTSVGSVVNGSPSIEPIMGTGYGAVKSAQEALLKAVSGQQRDVYTISNLLGATSFGSNNYSFEYYLNIYDPARGENIPIPNNGGVPLLADPLKINDVNDINGIIASINSNADLNTYVVAKNVDGNLVIEAKEEYAGYKINGNMTKVAGPAEVQTVAVGTGNITTGGNISFGGTAIAVLAGDTPVAVAGKIATHFATPANLATHNTANPTAQIASVTHDGSGNLTVTYLSTMGNIGGNISVTIGTAVGTTTFVTTETSAGDEVPSTREKNSAYSGWSGAGAEFLAMTNTIDQTASQSGLQLRLDTLGISDSAFGEFSVDSTGLITMKQDGAEYAIGQVAIAVFNNERGLVPMGDNLVKKSAESGEPIFNVNNDKTAKIEGRTLELSTADLSESLVNLMVFQRAFEANAKSITTSDELLNTLINLKR